MARSILVDGDEDEAVGEGSVLRLSTADDAAPEPVVPAADSGLMIVPDAGPLVIPEMILPDILIQEALDQAARAAARAAAEAQDAAAPPPRILAPSEIDAGRLLTERPDVFAAYFTSYFGPFNDRNSTAWTDRIGGDTPEDFARYWYKTYGVFVGYSQSTASAPSHGAYVGAALETLTFGGRTTADGISLAEILQDRPDVFRAYFTAYYGPNNDRNSDAWVNRVGGETIEDFANYWYETYGRWDGYVPSSSIPPPEPAPEPEPEPEPEIEPLPADGEESPADGDGADAAPDPSVDLPEDIIEDPAQGAGAAPEPDLWNDTEDSVIVVVGQGLADPGFL